jgi:hypothetical protein
MSRDDLRKVIETPARTARLSFAPPQLVDRILDDVRLEEGQLPLLQIALKEMWGNPDGERRRGAIEKTLRTPTRDASTKGHGASHVRRRARGHLRARCLTTHNNEKARKATVLRRPVAGISASRKSARGGRGGPVSSQPLCWYAAPSRPAAMLAVRSRPLPRHRRLSRPSGSLESTRAAKAARQAREAPDSTRPRRGADSFTPRHDRPRFSASRPPHCHSSYRVFRLAGFVGRATRAYSATGFARTVSAQTSKTSRPKASRRGRFG